MEPVLPATNMKLTKSPLSQVRIQFFFIGAGEWAADPEAIYTLCFTLKIML
jgi:hypothetical protein